MQTAESQVCFFFGTRAGDTQKAKKIFILYTLKEHKKVQHGILRNYFCHRKCLSLPELQGGKKEATSGILIPLYIGFVIHTDNFHSNRVIYQVVSTQVYTNFRNLNIFPPENDVETLH